MEAYYGFAFFTFLSLVAGLQVWLEFFRSRRPFLVPAYMALICAAGWHALNAVAVYYEFPLPLLIASGVVGLVIALLWLHAASAMQGKPLGSLTHATVLGAYGLLIAAAVLQEPQSPWLWAATNLPGLLVLGETSRRCFRAGPSGVGWLLGLLFATYAGALLLFSAQIAFDWPYGGLLYLFMGLLLPIQGSAFAHASVQMQSDALATTVLQLKDTQTDLRNTMEEVTRREMDYSRLVKNLPDIVLRADADGRLLYASERLCEIAGRSPDELIGASVSEALPFEDHARDAWQRTLHRVYETRVPQQFEFSLPGQDGSLQDYRGRVLPEVEGGAIRSLLVIIENVTESKQFVDALRHSEARFRELFESLQDVYYKTTLEGEILEISPSVNQWEYRREELIGTNALAVYADPADREQMIDRLRAERALRNVPIRLKLPNGEPVTVKCSATVVGCEAGDTPRIVGMLRDVSEELRLEDERAKLERQFLEAQKLESVGLLAGGVAHDFNNLLQGILGHADLLAEEAGANEKAARHLAVIIEAAQDAGALCRQLLDYSGRGHFVLSPVNLSDIVWDVTDLMEVGIPKPIELRIETTAKLPRIEGDSSQLRQVVVNLVKNAADAIGERAGKLTVSTGIRRFDAVELAGCRGTEGLAEGEYVYLCVTDTGPGIGPELTPRIFDPFFSTKENGQGLGLAAVIGIVRGHSGGILVHSEPGKETCFTVLFPPVDAPAIAGPTNGRARVNGNGQLVILADDEPMVLDVAREILEAQGFEVVTALDGTEAVAAFDANRARNPVVVLDVVMPEMNGIEASRAIREREPAAALILASGYADISERLTPEEAASIGLVPKPYRISELVDAIEAQTRRAPADARREATL